MHEHDYHAFEEKLCELAEALHSPVPLNTGQTKHLWMAARGFDLAIFRQACDDLALTCDFFPKPAELRKACASYGRSSRDRGQDMRCLHIDYARPPRDEDDDQKHWRCPALFPFDPSEHYCEQHRDMYVTGERATENELSLAEAEAFMNRKDSDFLKSVVVARTRHLENRDDLPRGILENIRKFIGKWIPGFDSSIKDANDPDNTLIPQRERSKGIHI